MDLNWQKDSKYKNKEYPWKKHQIFNNNLLFLHIWKTGGSSMKNFFQNHEKSKHASHQMCYQIIDEIGIEKYKKFVTFTVVRNPYDRVVSIYFYRKQQCKNINCSFEDFLKSDKFKKHIPMYYHITYNGDVLCKYILKLENIKEDLKNMLKEEKIDKSVEHFPKVRSSRHKIYLEYYKDRELIDIVNEYYKTDFELFGYEMM